MLYHVTSDELIADAHTLGSYYCPSLVDEGFIHCCQLDQLSGVVQRYYADEESLIVMAIDPNALESVVKYENTVGGTELFPHVYGPINMMAVTAIKTLDHEAVCELRETGELA